MTLPGAGADAARQPRGDEGYMHRVSDADRAVADYMAALIDRSNHMQKQAALGTSSG